MFPLKRISSRLSSKNISNSAKKLQVSTRKTSWIHNVPKSNPLQWTCDAIEFCHVLKKNKMIVLKIVDYCNTLHILQVNICYHTGHREWWCLSKQAWQFRWGKANCKLNVSFLPIAAKEEAFPLAQLLSAWNSWLMPCLWQKNRRSPISVSVSQINLRKKRTLIWQTLQIAQWYVLKGPLANLHPYFISEATSIWLNSRQKTA